MLELHQVCAGYAGKPVLRNLDLTVAPEQVTAIIGPNGCGKSTLLKTVAGLLPLQSGKILLDGSDLTAMTGQQRAQRIAYLSQSRPIPDITVERLVLHGRFPYLGYPRKYRQADYEAAAAAIRRMALEPLADHPLTSLSGGMRQKVYIAMALAQDTPTILMDEPTTFLDIGHQKQMMQTARELASQGKAVVLVLHDLPMALETADRLVLMQDGQIVLTGDAQTLFDSGMLNQVFGVTVQRTETPHGWKYYFA